MPNQTTIREALTLAIESSTKAKPFILMHGSLAQAEDVSHAITQLEHCLSLLPSPTVAAVVESELGTKPVAESVTGIGCDKVAADAEGPLCVEAGPNDPAGICICDGAEVCWERKATGLEAEIMDAAVTCFNLGPENQEEALRFGMKVHDILAGSRIPIAVKEAGDAMRDHLEILSEGWEADGAFDAAKFPASLVEAWDTALTAKGEQQGKEEGERPKTVAGPSAVSPQPSASEDAATVPLANAKYQWVPCSDGLPEAHPASKHLDFVLVSNLNHEGVGALCDREDGDEPIWVDEHLQSIEPPPVAWKRIEKYTPTDRPLEGKKTT